MHKLIKGFLGALLVPLALFAQTAAKPTNVHVSAGQTSGSQSNLVTCTTTLGSLASATVQTAINNAADGDVICLPSGSATWSSTVSFSSSKAVTIAGQASVTGGSGTSTLNGSASKFQFPSADSTKSYRITGFTISQSGGNLLYMCPGGTCGTHNIAKIRIDHNTIAQIAGVATFFWGDGASTFTTTTVLIDHNTITSPGTMFIAYGFNQEQASPVSANALGNVNNIFIEDNTVTVTTLTEPGAGCTDGWGSIAVVVRHNTLINCRVLMHAVTHQGGPTNFEVYNNIMQQTSGASGSGLEDGYRTIHHQGAGTYMVFNNTITSLSGKNDETISIQHYRDCPNGSDGAGPYGQCDGTHVQDGNRSTTATNRGYPCWRQPGREVDGTYKPVYVWNNKWSDTNAQVAMSYGGCTGTPTYQPNHMIEGREYFNAVSKDAQTQNGSSGPFTPFNGTTGMGFGRLVDRPTTCTTSTETAFGAGAAGVGYFATDAGTQGILYTCSATNTWTQYYTPYTYPLPWP